jgi:putative tryptophan/tyrosine transport system substrate-binding protein
MRRREFITLIGGAAATPMLSSRAVRSQQSQTPVIGFLHARSAADSVPLVTALRGGLADNGIIEGQNVRIEYRWAEGQYSKIPALAADLVQMPASLLITGSEPSALAAKAATSTIPIVFVVGSDPTKLRLVDSFSRPGRNATGIFILTTALEAKRLGLLHELVPHAQLIGILSNPNFPYAKDQLDQIQQAADQLGQRIEVLRAGTPTEIDAACESEPCPCEGVAQG